MITFAVANFDRALTVSCSVFAKVFPQWPGTIFPVKHVRRYRLVVNGDAAQPRGFPVSAGRRSGSRCRHSNNNDRAQRIRPLARSFECANGCLLSRHENLATSMPIIRDQIV